MIAIKTMLYILCSIITGFLICHTGIKIGFPFSKSNIVFYGSACSTGFLIVTFILFYLWLFGLLK